LSERKWVMTGGIEELGAEAAAVGVEVGAVALGFAGRAGET
jgi:hypothetical protein